MNKAPHGPGLVSHVWYTNMDVGLAQMIELKPFFLALNSRGQWAATIYWNSLLSGSWLTVQ